jgi:methionyl-tRNA formyltransferase
VPPPGTIIGVAQNDLLVQCGQGALALTKLQLAGRRAVTAREFAGASTAPVLAGSRFG